MCVRACLRVSVCEKLAKTPIETHRFLHNNILLTVIIIIVTFHEMPYCIFP